MLKIGICDDEQVFLQQFKQQILLIFNEHKWKCIIDLFCSGTELTEECKDINYDIIFLDIDMPVIDGFMVAEKFMEKDTLLVFCTSHNELVYNSFSYQPFWFLCKDNYTKFLEEVIVEARNRLALKKNYEFIINGQIVNVNIDEIKFIDVYKHNIHVHFGEEQLIHFRDNLTNIEETFQDFNFIRINSGCVVNMLWIRHILQNEVKLKDGTSLSLSRGRKNDVKKRFQNYMRLKR